MKLLVTFWAPGAMPHHLQNSKWLLGVPIWLTGSKKVSTPKFQGPPVNFGEKKERKNAVYSGHQHRCQPNAQTPTNWNTNCSCQFKEGLNYCYPFQVGGGLHVKITNIREGGQRTMFRDSFPSVAKYLIGPPLLIFGPKSDHFFQQNQTKIGPKCGPNGKKSDFTRYCKKIHFVQPLKTLSALLKSCSKEVILGVFSPHLCQNQTFECRIRPFSDLFVQNFEDSSDMVFK